ncbi:MAG: chromate efflux transporter [bacterium]|nr:chromate efflux transporter [bacterium]
MTTNPSNPASAASRTSLGELARLFVKLGGLAFGGPAAHIAMMRREVVEQRGWIDDRRFLDLLAAASVIPGPTSTELAIHVGWEQRRWAGLLVAGCSFIAPAMLITAFMGWLYVRYGEVPEVGAVLYGIKPVMVVIVVHAILVLMPKAARSNVLRVTAIATLIALLCGVDELIVLFGTGLILMFGRWLTRERGSANGLALALPWAAGKPGVAVAATAATGFTTASATGLFFAFLKIGAVLFGSGYVLLAFLRRDLVEHLGWLTEAQLLDAVAVGQVTPGPVFTTATFIGYVLAGPVGALAATGGIFLPAFLFVALLGPFVLRLRQRPTTAAFLDGVTVASLALMIDVTIDLGRSALIDSTTAAIASASGLLLWRLRLGSTWLILGGAATGLLASWTSSAA